MNRITVLEGYGYHRKRRHHRRKRSLGAHRRRHRRGRRSLSGAMKRQQSKMKVCAVHWNRYKGPKKYRAFMKGCLKK
jgi:hypothetical protein